LRWVHRQLPELLSAAVPDADVLITVYHHPPFRTPGVRRVAVVHDLCGLGEGFPRHKKAYWRHYLRLRAAAHLADAIWPISDSTRQAMAARFPRSRPRLGPVVYNGVDRPLVTDELAEEVLESLSLRPHDYIVAFATRQKRKNFAATLAALRLLRERGRAIRVVGIAPGRELEDVSAWCAAEGIEDAVILSGIPDATLDALYARATALVWPSTCEGFGYPVVEAMVQGCPPLVSSIGPGRELVGDAIRPLSSLSALEIADRIEALGQARARRELTARLRQRAASFSTEAFQRHLSEALAFSEQSGLE
jgi:glycosyltransferase involved in cell wall biosynthesis